MATRPQFLPFQDAPPFYSIKTWAKFIQHWLTSTNPTSNFLLLMPTRTSLIHPSLAPIFDSRYDLHCLRKFLVQVWVFPDVFLHQRNPDTGIMLPQHSPTTLLCYQYNPKPTKPQQLCSVVSVHHHAPHPSIPIPEIESIQLIFNIPTHHQTPNGDWHATSQIRMLMLLEGIGSDSNSSVLFSSMNPRYPPQYLPQFLRSGPPQTLVGVWTVPPSVLLLLEEDREWHRNELSFRWTCMSSGPRPGLLSLSHLPPRPTLGSTSRDRPPAHSPPRVSKHHSDEVLATMEGCPHIANQFEWALCFSRFDVLAQTKPGTSLPQLASALSELDHIVVNDGVDLSRIFPSRDHTAVQPPQILIDHPHDLLPEHVLSTLAPFGPIQSYINGGKPSRLLITFQHQASAVALYGATIPLGPRAPLRAFTSDQAAMRLTEDALGPTPCLADRLSFAQKQVPCGQTALTSATLAQVALGPSAENPPS